MTDMNMKTVAKYGVEGAMVMVGTNVVTKQSWHLGGIWKWVVTSGTIAVAEMAVHSAAFASLMP